MTRRLHLLKGTVRSLAAALLGSAALALLGVSAVSATDQTGSGFSITVDGAHLAGDAAPADSGQMPADIQVKYDGLDVKPLLNISTVDTRRAYQAGETVSFLATLNYPAWVARQEVLIYATQAG